MDKFNKVLVIAPHTDDIELGCGGTVSKLLDQKKEVYYVTYSSCGDSVPEGLPKETLEKESREAATILGIPNSHYFIRDFPVRKFQENRQSILEDMVSLRKKIEPDLVILPNSKDIHQDHQVIHNEGIRAFKKARIIGYELPWNNFVSNSDFFVKLSERDLLQKIKSLQAYKSQNFRVYFNDSYIRSLALTRGVQLGSAKYAECFELIRWII